MMATTSALDCVILLNFAPLTPVLLFKLQTTLSSTLTKLRILSLRRNGLLQLLSGLKQWTH